VVGAWRLRQPGTGRPGLELQCLVIRAGGPGMALLMVGAHRDLHARAQDSRKTLCLRLPALFSCWQSRPCRTSGSSRSKPIFERRTELNPKGVKSGLHDDMCATQLAITGGRGQREGRGPGHKLAAKGYRVVGTARSERDEAELEKASAGHCRSDQCRHHDQNAGHAWVGRSRRAG